MFKYIVLEEAFPATATLRRLIGEHTLDYHNTRPEQVPVDFSSEDVKTVRGADPTRNPMAHLNVYFQDHTRGLRL